MFHGVAWGLGAQVQSWDWDLGFKFRVEVGNLEDMFERISGDEGIFRALWTMYTHQYSRGSEVWALNLGPLLHDPYINYT